MISFSQKHIEGKKNKKQEEQKIFIKCQFEEEIIKFPLTNTTTYEEFLGLMEEEWGKGKKIKYKDEEGDLVTMRRTEELLWVWGEMKEKKLIVVSKVE